MGILRWRASDALLRELPEDSEADWNDIVGRHGIKTYGMIQVTVHDARGFGFAYWLRRS
jgi:hypothetical protein